MFITVSGQKGGVAKTCTSIHLASVWSEQGRNVCVVDADRNACETVRQVLTDLGGYLVETASDALSAAVACGAATPDVIEPLSHMIDHEQTLSEADTGEHSDHAGHDSVIRACVGGLGRVGDPRAAQPLFTLMQRNPGMRNAVLEALRLAPESVLRVEPDADRAALTARAKALGYDVGMLRPTKQPAP